MESQEHQELPMTASIIRGKACAMPVCHGRWWEAGLNSRPQRMQTAANDIVVVPGAEQALQWPRGCKCR